MLLQCGLVWESPGRSCSGEKTVVCIFAVRDNKAFHVSKHRPFHSPTGKKPNLFTQPQTCLMQNIFSIIIPLHPPSPDFKERELAMLHGKPESAIPVQCLFSLRKIKLFQRCLKGQTSVAGDKPRILALHRGCQAMSPFIHSY